MDERWRSHARAQLPRYTSYPTAIDFKEDVGEPQVRDWLGAVGPDEPLSLYVHIPFCNKLCWYCGCSTTVPNGYRRVAEYVAALHEEIDLWADALGSRGALGRLHFGGGSPNSLTSVDFGSLVEHIRSAFRAREHLEIDVEIDPRTLEPDFIPAMAESGVTRVSLGVQTLAPHIQIAVNRVQPKSLITRTIAHLRQVGVADVNFDLMYGLPHQTECDIVEACEYAAEVAADRISVFGYAHVPWFAKHQRAIETAALPGLDARHAQACAAQATLTVNGYEKIGMDHYALPGDSLSRARRERTLHRNFQGYTDDSCETLIGLGASSISGFRQGYAQSFKSTKDWREAVEAGRLPISRGVAKSDEDQLRADIIETLMCYLEADIGAICARHDADMRSLSDSLESASRLAEIGLCEIDGARLHIPEKARLFMRTVAACFDAKRIDAEGRHAQAV